jgi:hypothetical protein
MAGHQRCRALGGDSPPAFGEAISKYELDDARIDEINREIEARRLS